MGMTLSIDLETYSSVDLTRSGVYRYAESPDFEILLFGYSVNGGKAQCIDLTAGEEIPEEILDAFTDESVVKWAYNVNFERVCISAWLRRNRPDKSDSPSEDNYLSPRGWYCSRVWGAYMGLPLSLESVGVALGLEKQKMTVGKELIKYFSQPCKPTRANGGRTRNLPHHAPEKWEQYRDYNLRDVETEMEIQRKLRNFPVPDTVWEEFWLDQEINDRGVAMDMVLVENALAIDAKSRESLSRQMKKQTLLDNPNSVIQLKGWLAEQGLELDHLGRDDVEKVMITAPPKLAQVLKLRLQMSKSSVKKYQAMANAVCADGRARGLFQFYGANRSGRFSSKIVQLQNLPKNTMSDLEQARVLVRRGDYETLDMLYDDIPDVLSQLIRTAFIPKRGYKFIVSDFSAIEARVLSFLAGEEWRNKVFADGGDIYCMSASQMFGVPVEKHGVNGHLRQKGKVAELACGYGGSVGALKAMGAVDMGIPEEELKPLVDAWRLANPKIVALWYAIDKAAMTAVRDRTTVKTHGLEFRYKSQMLFIRLPSGRSLCYVRPRIGENRFGGESITYEGIGGTKKWERLETYGSKIVENITQGISRDILMYAMNTLRYCFIVGHVHDELIIECSRDVSVDAICEQMGRTPPWMDGLQLRADGYETDFYKKD